MNGLLFNRNSLCGEQRSVLTYNQKVFNWFCFREGKDKKRRKMVMSCVDDLQQQSLKAAADSSSVPIPPPLPSKSDGHQKRYGDDVAPWLNHSCVPTETRDVWDRLFNEGYKADVVIYTDNGGIVYAHANIIVNLLSLH